MDNTILKKRLNTFKSEKGTLTKVSNEVVIDVLRAWENWPGLVSDLYRELGLSKMQMVTMIQKAKRLVKSGVAVESDFKEVKIATNATTTSAFSNGNCAVIELTLESGRLVRFGQVEQLIDFLKKAA